MLKSALISICRLVLILPYSGPEHDLEKFKIYLKFCKIMPLVKICIGIDVEVKICTDLDSNGVALALLNNDNGLGRIRHIYPISFGQEHWLSSLLLS